MNKDIFDRFGKKTSEILMEIIAACMDDYLYVLDLQKDTLEISESAVERFGISCKFIDHAMCNVLDAVYKDDREMLKKHLSQAAEGKEKVHNLHYRWLDREGKPVWINSRAVVIYDDAGKAAYLIGCLNETGNRRRADNVTGLLGEMELCSYLHTLDEESAKGYFIHIGIDDFAVINSAKGVDYGNYILKNVADCIKNCLSKRQQLYYVVADQYVIVDLDSHSREDVLALRKRMSDEIYSFIVSENYESIFSISAGVIEAKAVLEDYEEGQKKLEFSLKQAKGIGKNRIYFLDQDDYNDFLRKGKIESALRDAIANQYQGLEVYYQPIVDCKTEKTIGAEALMRFAITSNGKREVISPVEFIPILEETGLIIPAGRFVINQAAKMCAEMQQYIPGFKMNINVSHVQIMQGNVAEDAIKAIEKYALDPKSLYLEMTESGFTDMTPAFCEFRRKLHENGIPFVMDDFGTGYSNLHCISDMNPNYVKLDKDFTAKAMTCDRDYRLFKNIITMVHSIDIQICVEGIEKIEWSRKMQDLQVDYLQGFLFGRPCDKEQFKQAYELTKSRYDFAG